MRAVNGPDWSDALLAPHQPPCVSIYMPAERASPPADQNRVRYRDMVDKATELLNAKYTPRVCRRVVEQLEKVPRETFGEGPRDAIAVFAAPDFLRVIDLPRPVDELVVVADSFHIKPLIRTTQFANRFSVLAFGVNDIRFAEGDQYHLTEESLANVPRDIRQASLEENLRANAAGRPRAIEPLHPASPEERQLMRIENFMRLIDQRVWENFSRDRQLPLIVFADAQHLGNFLALTRNPYTVEQGVPINAHAMPLERMREEAWKLIEHHIDEQVKRLGDQFCSAKAHHKGSDDLLDVAEAAVMGRIGTLMVDADHRIPGILHRTSGFVEQSMKADGRGGDDVLDDLAEIVLQRAGQVYVLPHAQMPTEAGVAAVYRF